MTARATMKLLAVCLVIASVPVGLYVRVDSKDSKAAVTVQAAGRGGPYLHLQDGHEMKVDYRGENSLTIALRSSLAQPRSLASIDLDRDGTPDVLAGYAYDGAGILTLQRGNPDAFAPKSDDVFARLNQGYNPESLLSRAEVIQTPEAVDFLEVGDFNHDNQRDVLVAANGGSLLLLPGDGQGGLGAAEQIALPGPVTAMVAGEFRAPDGWTDVAVGVDSPTGPELIILDGATGVAGEQMRLRLPASATAVEFGEMDSSPFMGVAVATESQIEIVHGWGRKQSPELQSRVETIEVGGNVRGLAVGFFIWNREGSKQLAALDEDGTIRVLQRGQPNTEPFSDAEINTRARLRLKQKKTQIDVETVQGWRPAQAEGWASVREVATGNVVSADATPQNSLVRAHVSFLGTDDLLVLGANQQRLDIVRQFDATSGSQANVKTTAGDMVLTSLSTASAPTTALALPQKLNGERSLLLLQAGSAAPTVVPLAPNTTITVDRTDDPAGAALTAASACTAAANDCSLRGAVQFANNPANSGTTISLGTNTYTLNINGTGGCIVESLATGNTIGDLEVNQSTTFMGSGAASTIINQIGTGNAAHPGDRVICQNVNLSPGLTYSLSGLTIAGGRDLNSNVGGGGIIAGARDTTLTMTNVTVANNQSTGPNISGGGGVAVTGGDMTVTNCTFGGANNPGASRTDLTLGNAVISNSGGGLSYSPGDPLGVNGATGNLTVTGTTFTHNTASSAAAGGGGLLTFNFNVSTGTANISTSAFSNNQATVQSGGALNNESFTVNVSTTSFTSNSAANRGGGIYVGGGALLLNGTVAGITFTGNTAPSGGSSVSTASAVNVSGTNTSIGGDIEVTTNGTWTNNAGSTLAPTNVVIIGGTFTCNNSTMNVGGNLSLVPQMGPGVGGIFNAGSGTVNIAGNLSVDISGTPAGQFNAGTGTFNFNGSAAQSITNTPSSITFNNLTDSNTTQPLTANNSFAVSGTLNVNGANAIFAPVAGAVVSGAGTLTGTGTARVTRTAATADFLTQYTITNKTLTNLTIDYNGAASQTVNNTPPYSNLVISGTGTKTLQGNTIITGNLNIAAATFATGNFNFALGGNWTNSATFTPGTGTVTFAGSTGTQTLTGNTTFFNLTLNNPGATTNFGTTTTTIGNDLVASAGTMDGGTSTIIFTGTGDSLGSIGGANPKNFHNLQINSPATISNTTGGNINILNDYTNGGTFSQNSGLTTTFASGPDGVHAMSGAGTSTFGVFAINTANTLNAGTHSFNVLGATFTVTGTGVFNGQSNTVTFNAAGSQGIAGDGAKNFAGLLINNSFPVTVINGTAAVDASVAGVLTLTTNLSTGAGAILQQSGTSTGLGDVIGTVRRTDLGVTERSFGNVNNSITINSGTPPTQMDVNLVKAAPGTFPATVKVVPRDITLTPTGGSGISATVKLRYIEPTELAGPGITESRLILWKNITGTWTPQGGTDNAVSDFVSLSGVSSFSEWAIAEGADLTLSKANNVSGSAVVGQAWNWTLTATNTGAPATFTAGQTILSDNLPNSNLNYGTPTVQNVSNITGSANISCSIVSNDLTCVANGGDVTFASNVGASSFDVVFSATPQAVGSYQNPRTGGGIAKIDPNLVLAESNETNNSPTNNTVTVGKANTTTTINSDLPDPSVVGQPVTVTWSVTVNAPGSIGAALTGNVTVSDGTNMCVAAVSAGQCDITFTSAGAKNLTATYAGDTNYNGSASSPATAHQVNKADTTTTITSDNPDPSTPGQSVTVQWTVAVTAPGAGTPTGNVNVTVSGGAETCSAPVATGQCSITLNTTGSRTLTATYVGDTNFNTSSDTESHQVCGSSLVTTTADSGAGSLRQIIIDACDGSTITFDSAGVFATPQTITLTTGELLINKNLTINAGSNKVTLSGNNASRVFHVNSGNTLSIIDLTISGGSATDGGAILNDGTLNVVSATLTGNAATADGGAISSSATATSLTLINTTISGNTAAGSGGGLIVLGGTVTSINATITNNKADSDNNSLGDGGGIRVQAGTVTLKNTIVAGNLNEDGASDAADDISGTVAAASSFNLIGTGGAGGLTNGVNNNQVGVANPGLGALVNNGGPTSTHALLSTSTAVDAGSNANLPADTFDLDGDADTAEALPVDQRGTGFPRQIGTSVDIGSFELVQADLSITKTDGVTTEVPGTSVTYTIVVSNSGPGSANGATVSDTFPGILTGITFNSGAAGGATGNTAAGAGNISDTLNMPSGSSVTYTVNATIQSSATGNLTNTATVTAPGGLVDPTPGNNSATDTDTLAPQADLSITKTDGVVSKVPGTSVAYTIVVSNNGPSDANGAMVADTFPGILTGVTFTSVAAGGATGNTAAGSGNISDTVNMPSGSSITYTATGTIAASATGTLINTATVTAPAGVTDPTPGDNTATDTDTLSPQADLSITKTDGSATEVPGTAVTYTITVTNSGPSDVTGAAVSDTFPGTLTGVTFTSVAAGGATGNTGAGSGNISDTVNMPSGSSITYTVTGNIAASATGTLTNTATVTAPAGVTDPTPGNNSATDTDTLAPSADVSVSKTDSPDPVQSGNNITYTITVNNTGPSDAQSLSLSDAVPANTTFVSVTTPAGWTRTDVVPVGGTGTVTFTRPTFAAGASSVFTLVVHVNGGTANGTTISNTATVSSSTADPTPGNNSATATTLVQNQPDISVQDAKVVEPSAGQVNMIFTVTLSAPAPAGSVTVNFTTMDEVPPSLTHATAGQDYTTTSGMVSFAAGEQLKTILVPVLADNNAESNETFLVVLSNPVNGIITDGTATGTILNMDQPGTILISELRTSGPSGAGDDFVEVYNNLNSPHTVNGTGGGYGLFKKGATCGDTPVLIGVIPNGTIIPARGHYLFVGSAYSLANYGGTGVAAGDQTLSSDIESDRNVALFSTASLVNISTATRLDAVSFGSNTGGNCDLLREGTTLTPLSGSVLEHSYVRDECGKKGNPAMFGPCPTGGLVKDSNVNGDDFIFVETTATVTVAGQRLGAPGPQNLGSARLSSTIAGLLLDSNIGAPIAPNRVRDLSPQLPNAMNGTLSIRRRFVNNTGAPVTRLRFRIVDISSIAVPGGVADLRVLTSMNVVVNNITDSATCLASGFATTPCTITVNGTTLEMPPAQALGGALNSSLSAGTITMGTPLAPGASINLQFLLGVQQTGSFKFFFNVEALP